MKRNIILIMSYILLMAVVILPSVSCIKFTSDDSSSGKPSKSSTTPAASKKPEIISFKAQPDAIKPGESVMLSWEVINVDSVEISPTVGKMDAKSTVLIQPTKTTNYVLTAGTVKQEITVNVLAVTIQKPDLLLTDLFIMATTVYMEVKNAGNEDARGNRAIMYVNNVPETSTYIEALRAGETRKVAFDNWEWKYRLSGSPRLEIKACVDTENVIAESNENNNCRTWIVN